MPHVVTWPVAECQFRPRALSVSHIAPTQHTLNTSSRNGALQNFSWGQVAPGRAVADCSTQIPLPTGPLQSDPSPAWGPGSSCFLSSPSESRTDRTPRGCSEPSCAQIPFAFLLSVSFEGKKGEYGFQILLLLVNVINMAFPTRRSSRSSGRNGGTEGMGKAQGRVAGARVVILKQL